MASRTPKIASAVPSESDFIAWLAETIQEKVAKENAGFVQIEVNDRWHDSHNPDGPKTHPAEVVLTTPANMRATMTIKVERIRS